MTALSFGLAHLAIVLLGLPAAFHPAVRHSTLLARIGASFLLGAVLLTLEGIVWSLFGIPWTIWTLGLPLGIASFAASILLARRASGVSVEAEVEPAHSPIRVAAQALTLCALAYFAWQLSATRATSSDLLFFWGVKGVRFAAAGGLDATLLGWPFFIHAHVNYPPLVPTVFAWGNLVAGGMPWPWVPTTSW